MKKLEKLAGNGQTDGEVACQGIHTQSYMYWAATEDASKKSDTHFRNMALAAVRARRTFKQGTQWESYWEMWSVWIKVGPENVEEGMDLKDIRKAEILVIGNNLDALGREWRGYGWYGGLGLGDLWYEYSVIPLINISNGRLGLGQR